MPVHTGRSDWLNKYTMYKLELKDSMDEKENNRPSIFDHVIETEVQLSSRNPQYRMYTSAIQLCFFLALVGITINFNAKIMTNQDNFGTV